VNTPEDFDLCLDLGAEAVITDRPGAAMAHLSGSV
jgi:glycerophosphoryl diester phosphodiesterase